MPGSDTKNLTEVEKWKIYAEVCKWTDQKTGKIVNNGIERIIEGVDQIEEKMWWMKGKVLKIQQDGATPHTALNSVKDLEAAGSDNTSVPSEDRWTIQFVTQSPNSPDLNICDLGLFWSFKSRLRKKILHN